MDYLWIIVMFLLDFHSDGTHSTAEDPLVSKSCNAKFLEFDGEKKNF